MFKITLLNQKEEFIHSYKSSAFLLPNIGDHIQIIQNDMYLVINRIISLDNDSITLICKKL